MARLELKNLSIAYGSQVVIRGFDLTVADAEMVSVLGPSGAGKSTILRAVAGLLEPREGDIRLDGRSLRGVAPEKRNVVMVFQRALLFPFMNVEQNIGFGLRMRKLTQSQVRKRIERIVALTRLEGLEARKVHELSGGQQQRVSLARALVLEPGVLLLDEPLSNLDAGLRQQMRELIQEIQTTTGITTLFVTHDQAEALMLSHRVTLLLDGRLRQTGTPRDLYYRPRDLDVARFFGGANFFQGHVRDGVFHSDLGRFPVALPDSDGERMTATIRPEDIRLSHRNSLPLEGVVEKVVFEGSATRVNIRCGEHSLVALTADRHYDRGQAVHLQLPPEKIRVFPAGEPAAGAGIKKPHVSSNFENPE